MAQERITPARETRVEKSPHPEPTAQEPMTPAQIDDAREMAWYELEAEVAELAEWIVDHPDISYRLFMRAETLEEAAEDASRSVKDKGLDIPPSEFDVRLSVVGYDRDLESYEPRRRTGCRST